MRSVRTMAAVCGAAVPVATMITGCVSTQTIAARARLVSARTLAGQKPTAVIRANPDVRVGQPALIASRQGTAIVVPLRNISGTVLTDLPISVGIRAQSGWHMYLNRSADLDYFDTHVAAIAPHATSAWVFTTSRRVTGHPFATVGNPQLHPALSSVLPQIDVSWRGRETASVANRSSIPQYDLPVYLVAVRGGQEVAAGRATVTHVGTHGRATVRVTVLGSTRAASVRLIAQPTIFS